MIHEKFEVYSYKIVRCEWQIDQFSIDTKTGLPIEETRRTIRSFGSRRLGRSALAQLQRANKDWLDTDYEMVYREIVKNKWESPF